jgi:hypothetical protein
VDELVQRRKTLRKFATFAAMTALLVFAGAGFLQAKTFVIPHIVESSGKITNTQFTFDTVINLVYVGGQAGVTGSGGVDVDLYLFNNNTGALLMSGANPDTAVCDPCSVHVDAGARKQQYRIDDLVTAKNPGWTGGRNGYGILVVGGSDPANLTLQGFVSNSHTSAFDMSVFGFVPTEISATAN